MIHIDFETKSEADLPEVGTDKYTRHPSTDVVCIAYGFDDEPLEIWYPGLPPPLDLLIAVSQGKLCCAHNAHFELLMWNNVMVPKYGWPELKPENIVCTMAMAYAMALPGSLEKAALAVGIKNQKDMKGSRVMLQVSQPRGRDANGNAIWYTKEEYPEKFDIVYRYCIQDVEVERELLKRLMMLPHAEREVWLLDYKINRRGVRVDLKAVKKAIAVVEAETDRLNRRMREITGNVVGVCTEIAQFKNWLNSRGIAVTSVAKAEIEALLKRTGLPADVREALILRQEAGKSSTAKLKKMLSSADEDGRVRGLYQFWGAATRRFAGRRLQVHNFPRPNISQEEIEEIFKVLSS